MIFLSKFNYVCDNLQIRQLAQEVRDLTLSRPVTILNGESSSGVRLTAPKTFLVNFYTLIYGIENLILKGLIENLCLV